MLRTSTTHCSCPRPSTVSTLPHTNNSCCVCDPGNWLENWGNCLCYYGEKAAVIITPGVPIGISSTMLTCKDNDPLRHPQPTSLCFLQIGEMNWSNSKNELVKLSYEASLVRCLVLPTLKTHNRLTWGYMVKLGHKVYGWKGGSEMIMLVNSSHS